MFGAGSARYSRQAIIQSSALPWSVALTVLISGCASFEQSPEPGFSLTRSWTVVVAPVVNLSDMREVDTLRLTDWVASEAASFDRISIVPVNLTLAVLARAGKTRVETAEDAQWLAGQFGADATLVSAITEYDPYDPPRMAWIMQWYESRCGSPDGIEPQRTVEERGTASTRPVFQVQRVFYAAADEIKHEIRNYADDRDEHKSAYGWRRYVKSQELYARYCCWSMIRTIIRLVDHQAPVAEAGT